MTVHPCCLLKLGVPEDSCLASRPAGPGQVATIKAVVACDPHSLGPPSFILNPGPPPAPRRHHMQREIPCKGKSLLRGKSLILHCGMKDSPHHGASEAFNLLDELEKRGKAAEARRAGWLREYLIDRVREYGLRFSAEFFGSRRFSTKTLTEISESLRKPPGVYRRT